MTTLSYFNDQPFHAALRSFYADLQIPVSPMDDKPVRPEDVLGKKYNPKTEAHALIDDVFTVGVVNDDAFKTEGTLLKPAKPDLKNLPRDYDGLLLFGVTLKRRKDGALPSRTILAGITRVFNQAFPTLPVTVVFRYGAAAGSAPYIALGNADRTAYKRQNLDGEKVGKVSLLKDIRTAEPHSGHLRILTDLTINTSKGTKPIHTFKALYEHWQSVFSIQTLNKRFYNELFHWYLWAKQYIVIPPIPKEEKQNEDTLTSIFTIRLLTRLLFIWFVKEKGLISKETFDEAHIASMLRKFDPTGEEDVRQGAREGSYYKAILQNLFFATLNTPMDKDAENKRERRQFIDPADKAYSDEYLDQTRQCLQFG